MTDRIKGLTVVLEDDLLEDDCQPVIDAISMLKGVVRVEKHVADHHHWMAKLQLRNDLFGALHDTFDKVLGPN